jgi:hypothetical protein
VGAGEGINLFMIPVLNSFAFKRGDIFFWRSALVYCKAKPRLSSGLNGFLGGTENFNAKAVSIALLAHKSMKLPIPLQVADDNFHEFGLGARERQLSAAMFRAPEVANPQYFLIYLHRPNGMP